LHGEGRESHTLRLFDELAMESASDRCLLGEVSGVTTLVSNSPRLGVEEYGGNDVDAEVGVIPSLQRPQIDHIVTGFVGRCVLTVHVGSCPLTPPFYFGTARWNLSTIFSWTTTIKVHNWGRPCSPTIPGLRFKQHKTIH
jgi:hypothetical protein